MQLFQNSTIRRTDKRNETLTLLMVVKEEKNKNRYKNVVREVSVLNMLCV